MKTRISSVLFALPILFSVSSARALERYDIDPVHSSVNFKVKHLFSYVNGRFNDVHGSITGDPAKPEETQVQVEIKTASIDTHEQKRDDHLRSDSFFDAEQYPTITFTSKKINRTGDESAFLTGDLTMHGVTKEIIMEVKFLGKGKGLEGRMHTGWEGKTALKRSDFGLTWTKAVEGTAVVSDDINISIELDAVEPKAEAVAEAAPAGAPASVVPAPPAPGLPPIAEPPAGAPPITPPPIAPLPPGSPAPALPPTSAEPQPLTPPPAPAPATPPSAPAPAPDAAPAPATPPAPPAAPNS
jgi:polyisoprenoid-binding protein YceI